MLSKIVTLSFLTLTCSMNAMLTVEQYNNEFSKDIYRQAHMIANNIIDYECNGHKPFMGIADVSHEDKTRAVFANLRWWGLSEDNCCALVHWAVHILLFLHNELTFETKMRWVALLINQANKDKQQQLWDLLLRKAAHYKKAELVRWLLDDGADPLADKEGIGHALYFAQKAGSTEIEAMLKESIKIKSGH